jgi:imidazolonepropionase-like amidohydrolase
MRTLVHLGALVTAFAAVPAYAETFVIRGATVYTASAPGRLEDTDVLVRDTVIAAVGPHLTVPSDASVIDAKGRSVTPGLFGGISDIGIEEIHAEPSTVDSTLSLKSPAWQQQWRPELDVTLAYNPRSVLVPVERIEGITWTVLEPDSADSIVAGQGAAVTLDGRDDAALPGSHVLFIAMGAEGAQRAGGTRAAEFMLLDQALREARSAGPVGEGALLHAAGREALARYTGGGKVVFEVNRAADILAVIAFAQRNGMQPIIDGGAEAWMVAQTLAQEKVPVILDPLQDLPKSFDALGATLDNAARLQRAGVRIAFTYDDTQNARVVRQLAGNAVAHGLPWEAALAAITSSPAEIFGLGATRGHIAVGQVADLVLWSGPDPLELSTLADQVWIGGRATPMRSRQTELRDRYLKPLEVHEAR